MWSRLYSVALKTSLQWATSLISRDVDVAASDRVDQATWPAGPIDDPAPDDDWQRVAVRDRQTFERPEPV